jgi:starch synthase (maltosyl-transferring)
MELAEFLRTDTEPSVKVQLALDKDLAQLLYRYPSRELITRLDKELPVSVERTRARFSTWYEMFPRSCGKEGNHGTFKDCEEALPEVARMGFDVVYFPPIHPIGITKRKGKNNSLEANPEDCGSPWAIGSEAGGHKATHPDLGTVEDFRALVEVAQDLGIEIALDVAFQCSPDHPYVKEHPEWFRHRPDGTVQYAENPPKKYEDIYPFEFESDQARELWMELKSVFEFWIEQGVTIFRVDNPHTKPFAFWEWAIPELRKEHPEVILLSEAFTRPKIMYRLGKLGFSQSYTYFAWRNTKWEISEYFRELTQTEVKEFFRPNAWPNTPDILTEFVQTGGKPAFVIRMILAATLSANYGMYGPAYEMCEAEPREPGSEEYLNSEKYELKSWDVSKAESFRDLIARVNKIRHNSPALQLDHTLQFHPVDNEQLICYSKRSADGADLVIVVVNLDPHHTHSGWVEFPLQEFGIRPDAPYQMHDLLTEERYLWMGHRNYLELNPHVMPAHIFRVRSKVRSEQDFEYYL